MNRPLRRLIGTPVPQPRAEDEMTLKTAYATEPRALALGLAGALTLLSLSADAHADDRGRKSGNKPTPTAQPAQPAQPRPANSGVSAPRAQGGPAVGQGGQLQNMGGQAPSAPTSNAQPSGPGAQPTGPSAPTTGGPSAPQNGGFNPQTGRSADPNTSGDAPSYGSANAPNLNRGQPTGMPGSTGAQNRGGVAPNQGGPSNGGVVPNQGNRTLPGSAGSTSRTAPSSGGSTARTPPDRSGSSQGSQAGSSGSGGSSGSSGASHQPPSHSSRDGHSSGSRPAGTTRSYSGGSHHTRPYHTHDHRYGRPSAYHVRHAPHAHGPPPAHVYYRAAYVNWYVHPYYRYQRAATVVVAFGFYVNPWVVTWAPPPRAGWVWSAGYYDPFGIYHPGYWSPVAPAPVYRGVSYVYVPGWWQGDIYVEGYYRPTARSGWEWVDGAYYADGTYVAGHWVPRNNAPAGYTWEAGFYDGEQWVEGFWRPEHRNGYTWVNAYFDQDGIYSAGYWMPTEDRPGYVWVPGWFDGDRWIEGYWVTESEYYSADVESWQAPEGWNDGWDQQAEPAPAPSKSGSRATVAPESSATNAQDEIPLAIPVEVESTDL